MARTRSRLALAALGLTMLAAAGCVGFDNPEGWAGPARQDDLLLVSTDKGQMSALDGNDYSLAWRFPTGLEEPEIDLEAIYGAPPVIDDTVYIGGFSGDVYALSLDTGEPAWDRPFNAGDAIIAGLAASDTALYVATDAGLLHVLDPETGRRLDVFDAGDSIWAAPLLAEGMLYVASVSGELFALSADSLEAVWDRPFRTEHGLISDPVLADGALLVGGIGRALHAVDADSGRERWSFQADNWFWGQPLVEDGTVYAPSLDGRLYALSMDDGSQIWSFEAEGPLRSSPVIAGGTLVIVDKDGYVYGLDPEDGQPAPWSPKPLDETVFSNPLVLTVAPRPGEDGEEDAGADTEKVLISAEGGDLFRLEDVTTGELTRLDLASGSFVRVEAQ